MSASHPIVGSLFWGLIADGRVRKFRVYEAPEAIPLSQVGICPERATRATRKHHATVHDERSRYAMSRCIVWVLVLVHWFYFLLT